MIILPNQTNVQKDVELVIVGGVNDKGTIHKVNVEEKKKRKVVKREGTKKELAQKFWKENQGVNWTRKEWIGFLMEKVGLTDNGASTYFANLKSGRW